jgi:hypothetical protein
VLAPSEAPFFCPRSQAFIDLPHAPLEESSMIPPSLLNTNFLFTLIPIWEPEPVPPQPCPETTDDPANTSGEASARSSAQPNGDADGVNDQVALRMVFKGFRLGLMTDWQAEAFAGYERFVENRSDDDEDRQRQDQRVRSAVRPSPHAANGPEQPGAAPSAPSDSE